MNTNPLHVFNRGAHKAEFFHDDSDYQRFVGLLYIGNSIRSFRFTRINEKDFYLIDRKEPLVEIIAYCLMPNHFHIALKELRKGGKTKFLKKICIGYANYYNMKYRHSGTIIQGRFKSKPVTDEEYLKVLINYIHLNPYGLIAPEISRDMHTDPEYLRRASAYSKKYEYSSYQDYLGKKRPENRILSICEIGLPTA